MVSIKNKSHAVTARDRGAGGRSRGRDHRPGRQHRRLEPLPEGRQAAVLLQPPRRSALLRGGDTEMPEGTHQVRMEFDYAGPGMGKGGTATLYLDGGQGRRGEVGRDRRDGLLRRRHVRRRLGERRALSPRTIPFRTSSPARSTGSRSMSAPPRPTRTIRSTRRSAPRGDGATVARGTGGAARPYGLAPLRRLRLAEQRGPDVLAGCGELSQLVQEAHRLEIRP